MFNLPYRSKLNTGAPDVKAVGVEEFPLLIPETRCGRALSTGLLVITYKPPALGVEADLGPVMVFKL